MRVLFAATLLFGFLLFPRPLRAAEDRPSKWAKTLSDEAAKQFDLGEYEQALQSYKAAYLEKPDPVFLFNIGQCYRLLGKPEEAAGAYKSYLRKRPDAPNRALVEQFIGDAERAIRDRTAPPTGTVAPESPKPETKPPEVVAPPIPAPRHHRKLGIALAAAGGVVAIVGAALVGYGTVSGNDANSAATVRDRNDRIDTGNHLDIAGGVLLSVGAATAVAGVLVLVLPSSSERPRTALRLTPTIGGLLVEGDSRCALHSRWSRCS
jgi:tetratricopeptide (TPR) repeat protein